MVKTIFAVALGGSVGAVARYLISNAVYAWLGRGFPWGTLFVNVGGSLIMGILFQVFSERYAEHDVWRAALLVGVLGALTTFSSFSLETLQLIQNGEFRLSLMNIAASVILCLVGVWGGLVLARTI
ncbi:MAG: fluoride efflux transporter CrcB [Magnetococcales bacterium]|nr:fluoride efflux transporter CrcB [Magnetococcales bacterium]